MEEVEILRAKVDKLRHALEMVKAEACRVDMVDYGVEEYIDRILKETE